MNLNMRSFPRLLAALLVALVVLVAPSAAPAKQKKLPKLTPVTGVLKAKVGIADQKSSMFADPKFKGLKLKLARRSVAWDTMLYDWQVADVDAWLRAARKDGVTPVITFARSRVDARRHLKPTPAQYRAAFVAFRKKWPWVKEFVATNESNHYGETTGRNPKLAAQYYKQLRSVCTTCKIAAATLVDYPNLVSWTKSFVKAAGEQPKYWALHNYVSANRFDATRTKELLKATKGQIWLTEVGGLVKKKNNGGAKLKQGTAHAAKVTDYILNHLARVSPRISRIYFYHWNAEAGPSTWDSGLVDAKGKPRPAFTALQKFLKGSRKGGIEKLGKPKKKK
jgi:hypothetical protein